MHSPIHIAVLECDELTGEAQRQCGDIGNLYRRFLEAGASEVSANGSDEPVQLEFSFYDVVNKQEYPDVDSVDAIFITGSHYNSFTSGTDGWITKLVGFTKALLQQETSPRLMGVCFGHQILGRACGVVPERNDLGWEVGVTDMHLTEKGKQVFGKESLALHQMHRDIVPQHPSSVEMLAHTDVCEVQGLYVKSRLISLQGHPEYNADIARDIMNRRRGRAIDEETYVEGIVRADIPHDGVSVGAAFVKFLLDD